MALRTIEVESGGFKFSLTSLPGEQALITYHRLVKHLLPALGQAIQAFAGEGELLKRQIDFPKLAEAARGLFTTLSIEELQALRKELLAGALVHFPDGSSGKLSDKDVFNAVFAENIHVLFELLYHAAGLNYARFFEGLRDKLAAVQAKAKPSSLPTTA